MISQFVRLRPGRVCADSTKTGPCEIRYEVMNGIQLAQDTVKLYNNIDTIKNVFPGNSGKFVE
jgi:hypothetical protein